MGMFDEIIFEIYCPVCNVKINNFQSKDKGCTLQKLNFNEVDNFYALCNGCKAWVEYTLKRDKLSIDDYRLKVLVNQEIFLIKDE